MGSCYLSEHTSDPLVDDVAFYHRADEVGLMYAENLPERLGVWRAGGQRVERFAWVLAPGPP